MSSSDKMQVSTAVLGQEDPVQDVEKGCWEETDEGEICCVCLDGPATNTLQPCGHKIICDREDCKEIVLKHNKCPLCRAVPKQMVNQEGVVTAALETFAKYYAQGQPQMMMQSGEERFIVAKTMVRLLLWIVAPTLLIAILNGLEGSQTDLQDKSGKLMGMWLGTLGIYFAIGGASALCVFPLVRFGAKYTETRPKLSLLILLMALVAFCAVLIFGPPFAIVAAFGGKWLDFVNALGSTALMSIFFSTIPGFRYSNEALQNHPAPAQAHAFNFFSSTVANIFAALLFMFGLASDSLNVPYPALVALAAGSFHSVLILPLLPVCLPLLYT